MNRAGPSIEIAIQLAAGRYGGITLSPPAGTRVVVRGVGDEVVFEGGSPALTILSGDVMVGPGVALRSDVNSPTILVLGGSLTVRGCVIEETTGGNKAAIAIFGGAVDLGSPDDPGNNTISVHGRGALVHNVAVGEVCGRRQHLPRRRGGHQHQSLPHRGRDLPRPGRRRWRPGDLCGWQRLRHPR